MPSAIDGQSWFRRVRFRLVLLYVAVAGLLFAASSAATFALVRHAVLRQLDRDLDRQRANFTDLYLHPEGPDRLATMRKEFVEEAHEIGIQRLYLLLVSPSGGELAASPLDEPIRSAMRRLAAAPVPDFSAADAHGALRHVQSRVQPLPDGNLLVVGFDRTRIDDQLRDLLAVLSGSFLLVLLLSACAGLAFAPFVTRAAETAMADLARTTDAIAHDLRTPVTRLRARAELALMRHDADSAALAGDVAEECAAMLEMINTLLDIAATEHTIHSTPRVTLDVAAVVRAAVDLYLPAAEDKGLRLSAVLPAVPVPFPGHVSKFQQLIGNLLDNAIKFTPSGGAVTVEVRSSNGALVLAVRDTGCGIADDDLPHVLERFYRADSARTLPGNGLGLSLVKAVATSYGGSVSIDSAPGRGTAVTVNLPLS